MASSTAHTPSPQGGQGESLNVIALISGGKDSFFSVLHCLAHGHRVVALANLHPPETSSSRRRDAAAKTKEDGHEEEQEEEEDLNSFMYQTVGHQVIPLYAEATGIPLYRQPILGGATQGRDYSHFSSTASVSKIVTPGGGAETTKSESEAAVQAGEKKDDMTGGDETESMLPLLLAIKRQHPSANAICAGAILSTYQRTRVESVAVRLGLTPLAFLWKFPILPVPSWTLPESADAQLLDDMAAAGMEARIIKVASGGLDDSFLWTNVADRMGKNRIVRSMRRFGTANEKGAVIGEGGEFETLVLDGPRRLFRKRIVVEEKDRRIVREGGGCAWLSFGGARLVDKEAVTESEEVRIPNLCDARFVGVLEGLRSGSVAEEKKVEKMMAQLSLDHDQGLSKQEGTPQLGHLQSVESSKVQQWCFLGKASSVDNSSSTIETETSSLLTQIHHKLQQLNLPPSAILTSTILLRHMTDFPAVNAIYGALFDAPNPPSRVCVACGDSLSALAGSDNDSNINIAIYLTVHTGFTINKTVDVNQQRQGLHVQSRSYWAPANIGPYSQAISIPLASLSSSSSLPHGNEGPRLVTIAGQIPLVPATMTLPPFLQTEQEALNTQLALSLQHLWRIGLEVGVQWWSSAVAYFPSSSPSPPFTASSPTTTSISMSEKAKLAYKTWQSAHQWPSKSSSSDSNPENFDFEDEDSEDEDSEDESGPDLWDRKFNPKYMSFATSGQSSSSSSGEPQLPDWKVLSNKTSKKQKKKILPPFFAAEVSQLPRSAGVEWHAHLGLAKVSAKGVEILDSFLVHVEGMGEVEVHQTVIRSPASTSDQNDDDDEDGYEDVDEVKSSSGPTTLLQTILIARSTAGGSSSSSFTKLDEVARLAASRLATSGHEQRQGEGPSVMVRYADAAAAAATPGGVPVPVVPCASLWSGAGEKLASVTIYQSVFE